MVNTIVNYLGKFCTGATDLEALHMGNATYVVFACAVRLLSYSFL